MNFILSPLTDTTSQKMCLCLYCLTKVDSSEYRNSEVKVLTFDNYVSFKILTTLLFRRKHNKTEKKSDKNHSGQSKGHLS